MAEIGRNDPCHCGSGKKYKKCHLEKDEKDRQKERLKASLNVTKVAEKKAKEEALTQKMETWSKEGSWFKRTLSRLFIKSKKKTG